MQQLLELLDYIDFVAIYVNVFTLTFDRVLAEKSITFFLKNVFLLMSKLFI